MQPADGGGHDCDTQPSRYQADDGLHLDGLLRDLRSEARATANRSNLVVESGRRVSRKQDEWFVGKRARINSTVGAQGMVMGQGQHERLSKNRFDRQRLWGVFDRTAHESNVDCARSQQFNLLFSTALEEVQHHMRKLAAEAAEDRGQHRVGGRA